ncbi:putative ribokinase L homeolog [Paratrimastix pyriformis]|uniref:Ribokinase n=1 Tax=Paratrimastix pyriformis TaxID=342808 RepID=A0ABQ8URC1_9EUKA|nr:putative ribokinase L homeolog [Paratrimastix pyriformis]
MEPSVCVVGACNMDLVAYVPRMPVIGETLHGTKFQMGFGGKGANQAAQAAKLGTATTFIGRVGDDVFGHQFLDNFKKVGIRTDHVGVVSGVSTGVAPINVDQHGANSIVIVNGANDHLTENGPSLPPSGNQTDCALVLVVQLEVPLAPTLAALRLARAHGVVTIVNPAPAREGLPAELLALADIVSPNEPETHMLTGCPVDSEAALRQATETLMRQGPPCVVLTLGARGAALAVGSRFEQVPVGRTPAKVVDTTGAGDSFVGSFATLLAHHLLASATPGEQPRATLLRLLSSPHEGWTRLLACIRGANVCASMSVEREGTQCSYPTRDQLPAGLFETRL